MYRSLVFSSVLFLMCLVFSGCGGNKLTPVTGTVTLDGKPVAKATVNFSPEAGGEGGAIGETDETGKYTLRFLKGGVSGAVPGKYIVTISKMETVDSGKTEPDMYDPTKKMPVMIAKNALPEKYNLFDKPVLTATIVAGKNPPVDFQLDSKEK